MPRFARLFEAAEDILEAYRDALKRRDADGALRLWLDEDSVSFILPDGQRLHGHEQLRGCLDRVPLSTGALLTGRVDFRGD